MKNQVFSLIATVTIALGIAGIYFLYAATERHTVDSARTPSLIGGITCLVLATFLIGIGVYASHRQD